MNAYNEELYLEMLQDDGIQHDADNVSEEMMNELFNNFIHGNLLSAAAMTRTLIECYVYINILLQEQDLQLAED